MSDAITEGNKEEERRRLSRLDASKMTARLKELKKTVREFETIKCELRNLGYEIKETDTKIKVFKEL